MNTYKYNILLYSTTSICDIEIKNLNRLHVLLFEEIRIKVFNNSISFVQRTCARLINIMDPDLASLQPSRMTKGRFVRNIYGTIIGACNIVLV